jgi:hypothetical protein
MDSNLITPPDILDNGLHSVTLVDPEQQDVDAIIKFCQYSYVPFNVYVYTPNMENLDWLDKAIQASDCVIINSRTNDYMQYCLLPQSYYYGSQNYLENPRKLVDPLHYFVSKLEAAK